MRRPGAAAPTKGLFQFDFHGIAVAATTGVRQEVNSSSGHVTATLTNGGTDIIRAKATATAYATYLGDRDRQGYRGVHQSASADVGTVVETMVESNGSIQATAKVGVSVMQQSTDYYYMSDAGALANAYAKGVSQNVGFQTYDSDADTVGTSTASLTNSSSGSILVAASATANAYSYAQAFGWATAIEQNAHSYGGLAEAIVGNAGSITATVNALASGTINGSYGATTAIAQAHARAWHSTRRTRSAAPHPA